MNSVGVGFPTVGLLCVLVFLAIGFAAIGLTFRTLSGYRSRGSQGAMFAIVGSCLFVAITLSLLITVFYLRSSAQTEVATLAARPIPLVTTGVVMSPDSSAIATVQLPSPPTAWMSTDLKAFDADVYPGLEQATAPLARQARVILESSRLLEINSDGGGVVEPLEVTIYTNQLSEAARGVVIKQFATELRKHFGKSSISIGSINTESNQLFGNLVALTISAKIDEPSTAPWDRTIQVVSRGTIRCEAKTKMGQTEVNLKYEDKPWVESFGAFALARPNKQFIAGYSTSLALSENDARREAMNDASEKLKRSGFLHFRLNEPLACDRFVQKLSRPYGNVWRAAVLFDLSSQPVATHAIATMNARSAAIQTSRITFRAIVFLFLMTMVLCVVLNLLTLGYYRVQISLGWAAFILGLAAAGGLLLIA